MLIELMASPSVFLEILVVTSLTFPVLFSSHLFLINFSDVPLHDTLVLPGLKVEM